MKNIILVLVLILSTSGIFGQNNSKTEQINAQKIAFFTKKLGLTTKEAQLFWPVYNDYLSRKNKLITDRKNMMDYCSENIDNLSKKEIKDIADKYTKFFVDEAQLLALYNEKFLSVLSADKVVKLYLADNDFKVYLLEQIRKRGK